MIDVFGEVVIRIVGSVLSGAVDLVVGFRAFACATPLPLRAKTCAEVQKLSSAPSCHR